MLLTSFLVIQMESSTYEPSSQPSSQPSGNPTSKPSDATVYYAGNNFTDVDLTFSNTSTRTATNITIQFTLKDREIGLEEAIIIRLPRFTRRKDYRSDTKRYSLNVGYYDDAYNVDWGNIVISPSIYYQAAWFEGHFNSDNYNVFNNTYYNNTPFYGAQLHIKPMYAAIPTNTNITIVVLDSNGIFAYCGFPSSADIESYGGSYFSTDYAPFQISTNVSLSPLTISSFSGIGSGCSALNKCSGRGRCNYCNEICDCNEGYGAATDLVQIGKDFSRTCADRICPSAKAIADLPMSIDKAHSFAECSNRGICNRHLGECMCFPPYTGSACEKRSCPNECSGHGQCLSIAEMTRVQSALNPSYSSIVYGSLDTFETTTWDHDVMYGCLCDSTWSVGFEYGQKQIAEWFGADCSLRHCQGGDDPYTSGNELDCRDMNQLYPDLGDAPVGKKGNMCHYDCSNRGLCDYQTGICKCFQGSWGDDCGQVAGAGTSVSSSQKFPYNSSEVTVGN